MINTPWPKGYHGQSIWGFTAPTVHHRLTVPPYSRQFRRPLFASWSSLFVVSSHRWTLHSRCPRSNSNSKICHVTQWWWWMEKTTLRLCRWEKWQNITIVNLILDMFGLWTSQKRNEKIYEHLIWSCETVSLYWSHSLNISRSQQNRRSKCWRCSRILRPLDCLVFSFINKAQWIWSNAFQTLSSRVPEMTLHWCCTPLALRRNQRSWPGLL